nr:unnamed protein product [Callosobruchus analis]
MEDGQSCSKRVRYGAKDFEQTLVEWYDDCSSSSEIELEKENWENSVSGEAVDDTIGAEDS